MNAILDMKAPLSTGSFLKISNNLSDVANTATSRTNLGLVSGGTGDIWVEKAGDTMTGQLQIVDEDAITAAVTDIEVLGHNSSGTPATNFGAGLLYQLESDTTPDQDAARIAVLWTTATHASRASALTFETLIGAGSLTEQMRITGDGFIGLGMTDPAERLSVGVSATYFASDLIGNTFWVGEDTGLIFGVMYIPGVDIVVDITDANPTEIFDDGTTSAGDGWATGELNEVTFPTGGDEHYLTVPKVGKYEVAWSLSGHTGAGVATDIHAGIMVDGVATRNDGEGHQDVSSSDDDGNMASITIIDCPDGTEEISLWVAVGNSNDFHAEHGTVSIKLIGGTTATIPPAAGLDVIEVNFHASWLESHWTYGGPDDATDIDEIKFFDC